MVHAIHTNDTIYNFHQKILLFYITLLTTVNPPVPEPCPIRGRYRFTQSGPESELYRTRVRGVTEFPRHDIDCRDYTAEAKSCDDNPSRFLIDAEYCEQLDHTGRPIGYYGKVNKGQTKVTLTNIFLWMAIIKIWHIFNIILMHLLFLLYDVMLWRISCLQMRLTGKWLVWVTGERIGSTTWSPGTLKTLLRLTDAG